MKTRRAVSLFCLFLAPSVAQAQGASPINETTVSNAVPQARATSKEVQPTTVAPIQDPPMPSGQLPPPHNQRMSSIQQAVRQQDAAAGQWVYTRQYGWIWMPYGDQYTYGEMGNDAIPYSYAYRPSYGWLWLAAPWVSGSGAYPYFGPLGPSGFGWYHGLYHAGNGWGGHQGGSRGGYVGSGNRAGNGLGDGHRAAPSPGAAGGSRGGGGNRTIGGFRGGVNSGRKGTPARVVAWAAEVEADVAERLECSWGGTRRDSIWRSERRIFLAAPLCAGSF
jgi:hypothetical protein